MITGKDDILNDFGNDASMHDQIVTNIAWREWLIDIKKDHMLCQFMQVYKCCDCPNLVKDTHSNDVALGMCRYEVPPADWNVNALTVNYKSREELDELILKACEMTKRIDSPQVFEGTKYHVKPLYDTYDLGYRIHKAMSEEGGTE